MDAYEKKLAAWKQKNGLREKKPKQKTSRLPSGPAYAPAIAARYAIEQSARHNRALLGRNLTS